MEENVALDSKKQKKFVKSIRGIKKLIKKNEKKEAKSEPKPKDESDKPAKPFSMRLKEGKIKKRRKERGLVYLSHIPHGFYEHQMTQYFKQFGVVTNARVIKSKRTGNSKGFSFVEFKEPSVAQIVAETMNNYLMGKRLIKAVYIPPEKQRSRALRKHWNSVHNPTSVKRLKMKKEFNEDKDEVGNLKKARKLLAHLNKTKTKLSGIGINYDFFLPVDIPEALIDQVIKKEKTEDTLKEENDTKPKKEKNVKIDKKDVINEKQNDKKAKTNNKNEKENKSNVVNKMEKAENKKEIVVKGNKKDAKPVKVNEKQQKEKEQKLKAAGVKSVHDFLNLNVEDTDESCDFDSDEYEKMLEDEDDGLSSGASDESDDESGDEESEEESDDEENEDDESEEEEAPVPKKAKGKPPPKPVQPKKQVPKQQPQKQQAKKQEIKVLNDVKRKVPQKPPVPAKKPKFEKQNQKPLKKQFKKK